MVNGSASSYGSPFSVIRTMWSWQPVVSVPLLHVLRSESYPRTPHNMSACRYPDIQRRAYRAHTDEVKGKRLAAQGLGRSDALAKRQIDFTTMLPYDTCDAGGWVPAGPSWRRRRFF